MYSATTYNVTISVESQFEHNMSEPDKNSYVFSYRIVIENNGEDAVHLQRRRWFIIDALGMNKEIEGEGVVGEKPVIMPGEAYEYASWCELSTDAGKMFGSYKMEIINQDKRIDVEIPEFLLLPQFKLN